MPTASPLAIHSSKTAAGQLARGFVGHRGLIFPLLIVASVAIIVTPLPPVVMDMLLASNLALAILVLLTSIQVRRPLEFSVFPTLLLGTTLFRLVLNIASTRLILTQSATEGTQAAGGIIESFGRFVAGGSLMVGLVIFAILLTIQFVVITKGSTRVSEVAARFVLDGLPGRQSAIDADLKSGLITEMEARTRRNDLLRETDFYGAMDGAGRFVRGDAVAGLIIVAINIVGGLYVGVIENGMSLAEASRLFTTLAIGDGLVSQLPAFLIALATGLIVTRSSSPTDLSNEVVNQVTGQPVALVVAGVLLTLLSFTGLPAFPLLTLSLGCFAIAFLSNSPVDNSGTQQFTGPPPTTSKQTPDRGVDLLELQLGLRVTQLVRGDSDLLDRLKKLRVHLIRELGIMMPPVRITDSLHLGAREYQFLIRGEPVASDKVYVDAFLAIDPDNIEHPVPGIEAIDPAFGKPARWIEAADRETAESRGYTVVSPAAVIATHLSRIVRRNADELLTRQHVHQLVARLKQDSPQLVDEAIPDLVSISTLHRVLTLLLRESIPVRSLETIIEQLADHADENLRPHELLEPVRQSLARTICQKFRDENRTIHAIQLDPDCEMALADGLGGPQDRPSLPIRLIESLRSRIGSVLQEAGNRQIVVLCSADIRGGLRNILAGPFASLPVISLEEVTVDTQIHPVATVRLNESDSESAELVTQNFHSEVLSAR